ncbi:MAG: 3-hydroxyacyl-CoA dehydrogenase [Gammaproteobacteria bacterium RIFCSPLOWO2_02_FULL_52_10]|nr:MAG: 3-hydroxyacyl-CoA dehydrogenase [Gammaproteobacteria bacterium RIFCSPLOWO2_02_FULL_52_10]
MKDFGLDPIHVGIIGAGAMGRGIAQVAASAGIQVVMYDENEAATADAVQFVNSMLERAVAKGRMSEADAANSKANIKTVTALAGFAGADLVIEAILEKLEVKQRLFKELEGIVAEDCILATNTSSLAITAVANAVTKQDRVAGCHFFNPVPLMKLVEVIGGVRTAPAVLDRICAFVTRLGHTPVQVADSPGFLVNHFGRGLNTEGLRVYSEKVAEPAVIDAVVRDCIGLRMGPFELMDLTALDVTYPVSEQIYEQFYHEPRLRPTPTLKQRYIAGLLGRKVGAGFYAYVDGNKVSPPEPVVPDAVPDKKFWVSKKVPALAVKLTTLLTDAGIALDDHERPQSGSIAIITPLGLDATTATLQERLDPASCVAVDMLLQTDKRITLMGSPKTEPGVINAAWSALARSGRTVAVIKDSTGFIAQRMVANIVNTACEIAQFGIAAPEAIDTGARLGLGYPAGPLAMGDAIGPGIILEILRNLQTVTGDPRYRPSPWLRRRAELGLSLLHAE